MKKINSTLCMSRLTSNSRRRAESPARSPPHSCFPRAKSTTSAMALWHTQKVDDVQTTKGEESVRVPSYDPLPQHEESHVGPYGVETPPDWTYIDGVAGIRDDEAADVGKKVHVEDRGDVLNIRTEDEIET
ncbi:hypothetical protein BKA66DRAFT_445134 [Pyrenochaeta sp. MPI-SDFR-AT-0127]|nr:hypothetical protein BKA66DRAFT_445134 [Pyrenochaeta sp. MPI-SDFR-AT-0127]